MTADQNKQIVRLQFDLLNAGDVKGAAALWAAESYNHGRKVDPGMMESVYVSLRSVQERHSLHEMVAEGEWVVVRTTCEGVHVAKPPFPVNSAIFEGLEPTGRKYSNQHMHFFRVVDGKLKEHWANRDDLTIHGYQTLPFKKHELHLMPARRKWEGLTNGNPFSRPGASKIGRAQTVPQQARKPQNRA